MTRERAKELLPVIQAYAEGKDIQYRKDDADTWRDVGIGRLGGLMDINVEFECQWRVKPEPRVWWSVVNNGKPIAIVVSHTAATDISSAYPKSEIIKVQEVL